MGVSHIIRGDDHVTNTGAQITIFQALGADAPVFGHHNLLITADGEGLSKRLGSLSLASLRADGLEPMAVASLASLIGTSKAVEPCADMAELVEYFDLSTVTKSAARFDVAELQGLNAKVVHGLEYNDVKQRLVELNADGGEDFWTTIHGNLQRVCDAAEWHAIIEGTFTQTVDENDAAFWAVVREELPNEPWDADTWKTWTTAIRQKTGRKGRELFMPLRLALTGLDHGPELAKFLLLIGWERTLRRLP
jgi:glutamyl-tRNA synthetase